MKSVHDVHAGLVVAPDEQLSLLDESNSKIKMTKHKSGTSPSTNMRKLAGSPPSSPTGRYDYSIVQHLDSTDI